MFILSLKSRYFKITIENDRLILFRPSSIVIFLLDNEKRILNHKTSLKKKVKIIVLFQKRLPLYLSFYKNTSGGKLVLSNM